MHNNIFFFICQMPNLQQNDRSDVSVAGTSITALSSIQRDTKSKHWCGFPVSELPYCCYIGFSAPNIIRFTANRNLMWNMSIPLAVSSVGIFTLTATVTELELNYGSPPMIFITFWPAGCVKRAGNMSAFDSHWGDSSFCNANNIAQNSGSGASGMWGRLNCVPITLN